DTVFLSAYRTYGLRWLYKHPTPYDFFNTFDELSGQDLDWFWRPWWYDTWTIDQAIASATVAGDKMNVVIEDRGLAPMPIRLAVSRSGGRWPARRHVRRVLRSAKRPAELASAPDRGPRSRRSSYRRRRWPTRSPDPWSKCRTTRAARTSRGPGPTARRTY